MVPETTPLRSPQSLLLWLIIVAIAALVAQYSGRFSTIEAPPPPAPGAPLTGRARVIDGDSLVVAGHTIRVFGIDAPEGRQDCRNKDGISYSCGRVAARALTEMIGNRAVTCTAVDHDQYERDVATCAVEGRDLGEAMVRAGHALDYTRHSRGRYASAEREARETKRGIWQGQFDDPAEWRRQNNRR
jgi:endonuclease YncB( thermonuclease family)